MNARVELIEELSRPGNKLTRTFQLVDSLEEMATGSRKVSIGISSNVSVDLLSTFLRKHALLAGLRLDPQMGDHDTPLTDVQQFADSKLDGMIFLPFFDNILPAFEAQLPHLSTDQITERLNDFRAKCRFVFDRAKALPFVFVAELHRFGSPADIGQPDAVDRTIRLFNDGLREDAALFANVRMIDSSAIVRSLGDKRAFDPRFYFQSTAPYTAAFYDELARRLMLMSRAFNSYYYKALVLDCDNTLWGGIIGEDQLSGIKLDPHSYPGKVFWRAQQEFLALERNGVLLCLCSKNNPGDVDEVIAAHPHAVIKDEHIAIRKVNWEDKVSNLRSIAAELNIGLDSLVFLDDSPFECAAIRAALPMVRVFQVPLTLSSYPRLTQEISELFLSGGIEDVSRSKTEQYRHLQLASQTSTAFGSHEEYLASLDLRTTLCENDSSNEARIAELSLKSNQFNLTTLRQTVAEIHEKMKLPDWSVYSLSVADRFGDSGLTGIVLMNWRGDTASVEAFLMSCRVIGRGVEFSIWPKIARDAIARRCTFIEARFNPTAKNAQVADFYDRLGLPTADETNGVKLYRMPLKTFNPAKAGWIKVIHD